MKGLEDQLFITWYLIANAVAIIILVCSWKLPRTGRFLFFLLFGWACWLNWTYAIRYPDNYLEYAELTPVAFYRQFILGWFSHHILLTVGFIATCQGFIALSMLLKGPVFKTGLLGGIVFLVAIAPLGTGSGFPCTLLLAWGMYLLWNEHAEYLWHRLPQGVNSDYNWVKG